MPALIVGGTSGIGLTVARRFAAQGLTTAIVGRDEARGIAAATEVSGIGARSVFIRADLADPASLGVMMQRTLGEFGHIDYACNCASFEGVLGLITDRDVGAFDATLLSNVRGTWICLAEELNHMVPRRQGAIVNVSSVQARRPVPRVAAYAASKAAIESLTRTASLEAAESGVRVNAVAPGAVDTPMRTRLNAADGGKESVPSGSTPLGPMATADQVARVVVWLCSEDAGHVTGQTITVDGGGSI